ncbi:unnamed protein product [Diatraea saccharalis]|uniref:Uncharacterized protein n=1 Tax=Diatraea saccharalis TaxID=40085 RepID=A0A9N9RBT3_9NEOP|nr:unnamed protein product [Diatraea saccharalis]
MDFGSIRSADDMSTKRILEIISDLKEEMGFTEYTSVSLVESSDRITIGEKEYLDQVLRPRGLLTGEAKEEINLSDLGILGIKFGVATTGAKLLKFLGTNILRDVFGSEVRVTRPVKRVDIRLTNLDDSITPSEMRATIAGRCVCSADGIVLGPLIEGDDGLNVALERCPVRAADLLLKEGRLQIELQIARWPDIARPYSVGGVRFEYL